jgi:hypothetical protein
MALSSVIMLWRATNQTYINIVYGRQSSSFQAGIKVTRKAIGETAGCSNGQLSILRPYRSNMSTWHARAATRRGYWAPTWTSRSEGQLLCERASLSFTKPQLGMDEYLTSQHAYLSCRSMCIHDSATYLYHPPIPTSRWWRRRPMCFIYGVSMLKFLSFLGEQRSFSLKFKVFES